MRNASLLCQNLPGSTRPRKPWFLESKSRALSQRNLGMKPVHTWVALDRIMTLAAGRGGR